MSIKNLAESYRERTGNYGHAPVKRDWGLVSFWLLAVLGLAAAVIGLDWSVAFVLIALVVCGWCWS